jgi:hypothetical protein
MATERSRLVPPAVPEPGKLADGADPVHLWHPQVHEDHVGVHGLGHGDGLGPVGRLTPHLESGIAAEHPAQAVAHHGMIVHHEHADDLVARLGHALLRAGMAGTLAETAVPPPGSDSISSTPETPMTR